MLAPFAQDYPRCNREHDFNSLSSRMTWPQQSLTVSTPAPVDILPSFIYVLTYERANDRASPQRAVDACQTQGCRGRAHAYLADRGWAQARGQRKQKSREDQAPI